jgi:hypothetical protein
MWLMSMSVANVNGVMSIMANNSNINDNNNVAY